MARNKNSDDEGMNLDSLMDALTNVVAVLILVLVLVQVDVSQKVSEFLDNLKPATAEDIAQNEALLKRSENDKAKLLKMLEDAAPRPEEIQREQTDLAILEKDAKLREDLLIALDELKKMEVKSRAARNVEQKKTETQQRRIAELEAQLDQTPMPVPPPATVVSIPNSRSIPKNAQIYYAIVHKDRVHFIDPFTPTDKYIQAAKKNRKDWVLKRVKQKGRDKYIHDQRKIVAYFKENPLTNQRGQKILVPGHPYGTALYVDIKPDLAAGGTTIDQLSQKRSQFENIMRKLSSNRRAVVMFRVHPNGFDTYLAARKVAERQRVAAGWEINGWGQYRFYIRDIEVNALKTRPPADPNAKPKPPSPPRIGPKLD